MLTVEEYGKIRIAHRDGMSIRRIARRFNHSRRKVRQVLAESEPRPYTRREDRPASRRGPYKALIEQILAEDEQAPRKQQHTAAKLYRRLRDEYGYAGGYDQVRRYVGRLVRDRRETFLPLTHPPGRRLEADFGHIYVDFPDGRRLVSVLLLTWSCSGYRFAVALPSERTEAIRCQWLDQHENLCLIGNSGVGKTHLAIALGRAVCRAGRRVRFFTAANLVTRLEQAQKQYQLDRFLGQLDRLDLLICDELGYLSFSRTGAELLFQVFADRYERSSLLLTSNLPFSEWGQVFQGERMTAALLDRLTHHCHIFELTGESYRFRESVKKSKSAKP